MTPDQAHQLVARIAALWPADRLTGPARDTWADTLTDLDHTTAGAAIDQLANTEARRPSLAAIRQAATSPARPATGARVEWEVLVHWLDPKGAWQADRRWHTSPEAARADFATQALHHAGPGSLVELLEHTEGRPVRELDRAHGAPEPAA